MASGTGQGGDGIGGAIVEGWQTDLADRGGREAKEIRHSILMSAALWPCCSGLPYFSAAARRAPQPLLERPRD